MKTLVKSFISNSHFCHLYYKEEVITSRVYIWVLLNTLDNLPLNTSLCLFIHLLQLVKKKRSENISVTDEGKGRILHDLIHSSLCRVFPASFIAVA